MNTDVGGAARGRTENMNQASEKRQGKQSALPVFENRSAGDKDILFYVAELKSEECACGRPKNSGYSFCYRDYKSLPLAMQKALFRQVGNGYEEAYEAAYKWLFG